jgi:hypothetical protein
MDSYQNSYPTVDDNFPKIKYQNYHINYFCKNRRPKIVKPVGQANYHVKLTLKIGSTHFQYTELKI